MSNTTPRGLTGLAFGGDYNPEQWPEPVWEEDARLMREAGVTMVSLGIFSWALLEPEPGRHNFAWLDRVVELLHAAGVRVALATPTMSPPAWFYREHPEALPVTEDGVRYEFGSRGAICYSNAAYRAAAAAIAEKLAERYGDHPALAMWHVHNEYGMPVSACYCDRCAAHFRRWLAGVYGTVDAVNEAWGTAFWGQRYGDLGQINPPRTTPTAGNQGQALDYRRFADATMRECFVTQRDILHRLSPGVPVTTNFMAALTHCDTVDYWAWAREVDIVTNDSYLITDGRRTHVDLAMSADISRSLAGGSPWLLLEHSTSGVNWQPRNPAKARGQMARNSIAHVARGSDGAMFFQWRQSRSGAEKFHSAMLPNGGTDTRIWREVVELGGSIDALGSIRSTRTVSDVAMIWDWNSWWAQRLPFRPSEDHDARERAESFYEALYDRHLTVDVAHPEADLSAYPLVVVPALYLMTKAAGKNIEEYVANGGTLVVSYFSGIVDEHDRLHEGPFPSPLREVLGVTVEEFSPLLAGERVRLARADGAELVSDVWTEFVVPRSAETVWTYVDGLTAGLPAITRNTYGRGSAWYVSTRLDPRALDAVIDRAAADARIGPRLDVPRDVEVVRRTGESGTYLFAINHTEIDAEVPLEASGAELLTGARVEGRIRVPEGAVRVVQLDE